MPNPISLFNQISLTSLGVATNRSSLQSFGTRAMTMDDKVFFSRFSSESINTLFAREQVHIRWGKAKLTIVDLTRLGGNGKIGLDQVSAAVRRL